ANDYKKSPFDYIGFVLFVMLLLGVNIVVTQGQELGWTSPLMIVLMSVTLLLLAGFLEYEKRRKHQFIDFNLFKIKPYTGAVVSNFLQNGIVATIVVANIYEIGRASGRESKT